MARMAEDRSALHILRSKSTGSRSLGRPRRRLEWILKPHRIYLAQEVASLEIVFPGGLDLKRSLPRLENWIRYLIIKLVDLIKK